jgi:hypothetical protein
LPWRPKQDHTTGTRTIPHLRCRALRAFILLIRCARVGATHRCMPAEAAHCSPWLSSGSPHHLQPLGAGGVECRTRMTGARISCRLSCDARLRAHRLTPRTDNAESNLPISGRGTRSHSPTVRWGIPSHQLATRTADTPAIGHHLCTMPTACRSRSVPRLVRMRDCSCVPGSWRRTRRARARHRQCSRCAIGVRSGVLRAVRIGVRL